MNAKLPNLALLRDTSYGVPTDVTFQITEVSRDEKEEEVKEILGEVKGHKVLLAAASEVFKNMFFGDLKEMKDVIPIEDTTVESFECMLDYIYDEDIDWSAMTLLEMYDVINLATMYFMTDLVREIKTQMGNLVLDLNNVMEVAHTATLFSQFEDVSNHLLLTCARYIQANLKTEVERCKFTRDQSGTGKEYTALRLMVLVQSLASAPIRSLAPAPTLRLAPASTLSLEPVPTLSLAPEPTLSFGNASFDFVYSVIRGSTEWLGVTRDTIMNRVGGDFTEVEVEWALDFLVCEGYVYSTVDEDHFKATDMDD